MRDKALVVRRLDDLDLLARSAEQGSALITQDLAIELIRELCDEVRHWMANHENLAIKNAILRQRPDLPVDRIPIIKELFGE